MARALVMLAFAGGLFFPRSAAAENVLTIGSAQADAGRRDVNVLVTASHDVALHGFSLAFAFPSPELRLNAVQITGTHIGPLEPEFVAPHIDNDLGVGGLGVIFEFSEPFELSELPPPLDDKPVIVSVLNFDVSPDAAGGRYDLDLRDGIGTPTQFNRFTHRGTSLVPRLDDGSFTITGGDLLKLEKKLALPGATPNLPIFALARHAEPLDGFQIAFTFDRGALTLIDSTFRGTDVFFELGENGVETFNFDVDEGFTPTLARAGAAVLFDGKPPFDGQTLSPSTGDPPVQTLVRYTFEVKGNAASLRQFQDLKLENVDVPGAIDNRFLIAGRSTDPALESGKIYFSRGSIAGRVLDSASNRPLTGVVVTTRPDDFKATSTSLGEFRIADIPPGLYSLSFVRAGYYDQSVRRVLVHGAETTDTIEDTEMFRIPANPLQSFVRGDCDNDGELSGVTDSIVMLNFNFQGGAAPGCLAACDANGDGAFLGGITDAVFLLNFQFQGGASPPAPFPRCGPGTLSSDRVLGCERRAATCR